MPIQIKQSPRVSWCQRHRRFEPVRYSSADGPHRVCLNSRGYVNVPIVPVEVFFRSDVMNSDGTPKFVRGASKGVSRSLKSEDNQKPRTCRRSRRMIHVVGAGLCG